MTQRPDMLAEALEHARQGRRVVPLHELREGACSCREGANCRTAGKHPRWRKGDLEHGILDATTDEKQIRSWWGQWPRANIGIATGGPDGFWVLDVDPRHGGDETLAALEAQFGSLPHTAEAITGGGGRHLLFKQPAGFEVRNIQRASDAPSPLGPGLDLRGTGGLIVGAGSLHASGRRYCWEVSCHPDETPIAFAPDWLIERVKAATAPAGERGPALPVPGRIPHGRQHDTLVSLAGSMRQRGMEVEEIDAALQVFNRNRLEVPGEPASVRKIAESMNRYPAGGVPRPRRTLTEIIAETQEPPPERRTRPFLPPGEEPGPAAPSPNGNGAHAPNGANGVDPAEDEREPGYFHFTDVGNALRLKAAQGQDMRYCAEMGSWFVWDGGRWARDRVQEVERRAKETVALMFAEAAAQPSAEKREALAGWALKCESASRLRDMLATARSELAITPEDFDRNPWQLNCANGTVDLKTGDLLAHDRAEMHSKTSPVVYDWQATCPLWEAFLARVLAEDADLIAFVQRGVGYTLTADVREQVFFLLYGTGANGKSTFLDTLRAALGDYGRAAEFSTFLAREQDGGIRNDLARLAGARFVSAAEADSGRRLSESLVKQIVSQEPITARFLHREFFEFPPTFKVWLAANHKPVIRGTDEGIWRRIRLVPFTVAIPKEEQDRELGQQLLGELPGILTWAVRGCLEWQRIGLGVPASVADATQSYRDEMDTLGGFIADRCTVEADARAPAAALYREYVSWCEENGEKPLTQKLFGTRLGERPGLAPHRTKTARLWLGIGIISAQAALKGDG